MFAPEIPTKNQRCRRGFVVLSQVEAWGANPWVKSLGVGWKSQ